MASDNVSIGRFMLDGILPAPRGMPQIEVTFDIDADGILTVSARDKATDKEQHITITGRSGMDQHEVDRLVREAESHSQEDRARREHIETRNGAESAAYQAEKLVKDNEDKIPAELKTDIEAKVKAVRDLLGDENAETSAIAAAVTALQTSLQNVGQAVYAADQQTEAQGSPGQEPGSETPSDGEDGDDTVEGKFREV